MAKEKKYREPVNWNKELRLAPGYLILIIWITFTFVLLGWVLLASFSTTKEIFSNKLLDSGLHFENYVKAWINSDVAGIFRNSLVYSIISCTLLIIICAPAAYVLARFIFPGNKLIQTGFVSAMGVPVVMIVLPLFGIVANMGILNHVLSNAVLLIFLYIGINVPYTTIFLMTFFSNLSRAFEEAAAIDGCDHFGTLIRVVLPLSAPIMAVIVLFYAVGHWNAFFNAIIYLRNQDLFPLQVVLRDILLQNSLEAVGGDLTGMYEKVMRGESMKYALIIVASAPVIMLYPFVQKYFVKGVMVGAIKG